MEQPKKRIGLGLILALVGVGILGCIGLVLILVFVVFRATQPAADAGQAFMTALKDRDYAAAYALCTRDLQDEIGSARDLEALIEEGDASPVSWNFSSRNVENDQAQLTGDGTFSGGRQAAIEIVLQKVDGTWKVAGFHFTWK